MGSKTFLDWPVIRQLRGADPTGRGTSVTSQRTRDLEPRTADADGVAQSICPYCAVGCGQRIFHKDGKVIQIEGDPDDRSEEHTSELQSRGHLVCRLLLEKKI